MAPTTSETRATLAEIADWNRLREQRIPRPGKTTVVRSATLTQLALQMLFHEVHHRAQAMALLRLLGIQAQNLDCIIFAYEEREESA